MEFISRHKKLIILSIIPFILSIFNCYIYLEMDTLIIGIIPLSWRVIITTLILFISIIWPLMTDYDELFGQDMNLFFRGVLALVYCYGITLAVHVAMIAIYWIITLAGAAIYIIFSIIKFIFGIFA